MVAMACYYARTEKCWGRGGGALGFWMDTIWKMVVHFESHERQNFGVSNSFLSTKQKKGGGGVFGMWLWSTTGTLELDDFNL